MGLPRASPISNLRLAGTLATVGNPFLFQCARVLRVPCQVCLIPCLMSARPAPASGASFA